MLDFEKRTRHFDELFNTSGLMWLGQNTNHFPVHPAVKQAMVDCIEAAEFQLYAPPAGIEELRRLILADLGLEQESVLVTDGAIEGLYHTCRTLCADGDELVTTDPGWRWPHAFARASGAEVVEIPIYGPEHGYKLSPDQLQRAVSERTRIVYLIDPLNPLGTSYSRDEIKAFTDTAREAKAYLLHDCTYRPFAENHTLAAEFYPEGTITTYSFSKWLGLAGLRVGAVVGSPATVGKLAEAPPNNLGSNVLSQRAAIAGLKIKSQWFPEIQARQRANQEKIREVASTLPGVSVPVFPSQGNFMILDTSATGVMPDVICDVLKERGILIRHAGYHTERFETHFVKISTSVPEDWIEQLCAQLPDAIEEARGVNRKVAVY